jgi:GDP-mannose transporter
MVYYNNLLSVPLLLLVASLNGEILKAVEYPDWASIGFQITLLVSGVVGFALNGAALWCVQATSPSTYSMVGALNKIPLAVRPSITNPSELPAAAVRLVLFLLFLLLVFHLRPLSSRVSDEPGLRRPHI